MDFVIDKDEIVIQIAEASKHVQASAPPVEDLILDQVQLTAEHTMHATSAVQPIR